MKPSIVRKIAAVYSDGGVIDINPSPLGGTWAWVWVDADGRRLAEQSGVVLPASLGVQTVSNNVSELFALLAGLSALPHGWSGHVYSDSQITLGRLFREWKLANVPPWLVEYGQRTLRRIDLAKTQYTLVAGHPTAAELAKGFSHKRNLPVSAHNVRCDELCTLRGRELKASLQAGELVPEVVTKEYEQ